MKNETKAYLAEELARQHRIIARAHERIAVLMEFTEPTAEAGEGEGGDGGPGGDPGENPPP